MSEIPKITPFRRGVCLRCKQSNELHEGKDGRWYCEDCLVRVKQEPERTEQPKPEQEAPQTPYIGKEPAPDSKAKQYLDYIVTEANEAWIRAYLWKSLGDNCKWVELLEKERNERVLLRMATELGYGAPPPSPEKDKSILTETKRLYEDAAKDAHYTEPKKSYRRPYRRRAKGSPYKSSEGTNTQPA